MLVNERLRILIHRKGYTPTAVAQLCGMSKQQMHQIVKHNKDAETRTVERILEQIGATMGELYAIGEDEADSVIEATPVESVSPPTPACPDSAAPPEVQASNPTKSRKKRLNP
jgi:transcriptional regulator with XRE-family HTH domain